mgnify:CR=1 FL=1
MVSEHGTMPRAGDMLLVSGTDRPVTPWYATPCYCCEQGDCHGNVLFWAPKGSAHLCPACWTDAEVLRGGLD